MRPGLAGVLLDIDETLVDSQAGATAGLTAVCAQFLPWLSPEDLARVPQHWLDSQHIYQRYVAGELTFLGQRQARASALHRDFGGPPLDDELTFLHWNNLYERGFADGWRLLPGAREVLRALARADIPTGAITNAEVGHQRRKLRAVGLAELPIVVGLDTLGVGKPDPRVFARGAAGLGLPPGRCVYLGDQLEVDALGATAAGLVGCWFRAGRAASALLPAAQQVDSWVDFAAWLGVDLGSASTAR
ncbi:MAG: HAD family hydrolase [Angustibacter sp.]